MTFTVETGSSSATATSYVTVAWADTYLAANPLWPATLGNTDPGYDETAAAQTLVLKQQALAAATQGIDLMYGAAFLGQPVSTAQALEWPRTYVKYGAVPVRLQQATAELAVDVFNGGSAVRDINPLSQVTDRTVSGAGFSKSESYSDASTGEHRAGMLRVELLLQHLVQDLDQTFAPAYFNR